MILENADRQIYGDRVSTGAAQGGKMGNRKKQLHKLVCQAIESEVIFLTKHATERSQERGILVDDILYSALKGAVIEENCETYANPTCHICGRTMKGTRVYSIWAYNEKNGVATLITVFNPDANPWNNSHKRR
ncbi:hypothetical protein B4U84_28015 [Westiellopsis prolifica IICB1]|nr:hypothetical protein B4U84_28015 [Westiellopsis prolifica IICB1]